MPMNEELTEEQHHLATARAELARMRERTLALDVQGGDAVSTRAARRDAVAPGPLARGRPHDRALLRSGGPRHRRALVHRPPPRHRRRRRPARHRLAGARVDDLLPRVAHRADGRAAAATLRLRPRLDHRDGGRAPARRGRAGGALADPRQRDRAPARRPHARHRRDDPARAGCPRPRRCDDDGLHPGGARAPARPRSACTVRRGCSMPTAQRLGRSGVLVIGPNDAFLEHIGAVLPDARRGRGPAHEHRGPHRVGADPRDRADERRAAQGRRPHGGGAPPGRVVAPRAAE